MLTLRAFRLQLLVAVFVSGVPLAMADISVKFECTVPVDSSFDCNLLKRRFFQEKGLPFVKEPGKTKGKPAHELLVSVSRVPQLNGFTYVTKISEPGQGNQLSSGTFVSDGMNSTSVLPLINGLLQQGVLVYARQVGEAEVSGEKVTATYQDPSSGNAPHPPKADGRWVISPSGAFDLSGASQVPLTYNVSGGAEFNYSGDRQRYQLWAKGSYNHQNQTVLVNNAPQYFGVSSYRAQAIGSFTTGIDKRNRFNFSAGASGQTYPLQNVNAEAHVTVGAEYNPRPYLTADNSDTFAVGCYLGPSYYDFTRPNLIDKPQLFALSQTCKVTATLLLDKQRGTKIQGGVGESWLATQPTFVGVGAGVFGMIRITDKVSLNPYASVGWQTKSIATASAKSMPDYSNLTPQQTADAEFLYNSQSASSSSLTYNAGMNLSVTLGPGASRSLQDQRGIAAHTNPGD
ncbi:MAG: hypothetical protein ACXWPM_00145 [Bdellovibrionota bacterium]